jgi:hypothetical protein
MDVVVLSSSGKWRCEATSLTSRDLMATFVTKGTADRNWTWAHLLLAYRGGSSTDRETWHGVLSRLGIAFASAIVSKSKSLCPCSPCLRASIPGLVLTRPCVLCIRQRESIVQARVIPGERDVLAHSSRSPSLPVLSLPRPRPSSAFSIGVASSRASAGWRVVELRLPGRDFRRLSVP